MPMEQVTPTRAELHATRAQLKLAAQGEELLRQKRNALMEELLSSADAVMAEVEALDEVAAAARHSLALAQALDGPAVVGSLGLAQVEDLNVPVTGARVMGVNVLRIEPQRLVSSSQDRPSGPAGSTPRLEALANAFETELEVLLQVANSELRLRRLAEAIRQTSRRVNALEHILLPQLRHRQQVIELRLGEREREEVYRLKRIKERRAQHRRVARQAGGGDHGA